MCHLIYIYEVCNIMCHALSIIHQIVSFCFLGTQETQFLSLGWYFGGAYICFANFVFSFCCLKTLLPECVYRLWDFLWFGLKYKSLWNTSRLLVWGFLSFPFSIIFGEFIERMTFPPLLLSRLPPGPHCGGGGPRRCSSREGGRGEGRGEEICCCLCLGYQTSMPRVSDLYALNIGSLGLGYRISMPGISDV